MTVDFREDGFTLSSDTVHLFIKTNRLSATEKGIKLHYVEKAFAEELTPEQKQQIKTHLIQAK